MEKFSCVSCGKCCKIFGEGNDNYLPLYDFELGSIESLAKKYKKKLVLKPAIAFYDEISKKYFVLIYGMFNAPCPFYMENKCQIYGDRFFVCRSFPLFWVPKYAPENKFGKNCIGKCPNFDFQKFMGSMPENITLPALTKKTKACYSSCYGSSLASNQINIYLPTLLRKLEARNLIKIKQVNPETIPKDSIILPLMQFLVGEKLITSKKRDNLLKKFNKLKYDRD